MQYLLILRGIIHCFEIKKKMFIVWNLYNNYTMLKYYDIKTKSKFRYYKGDAFLWTQRISGTHFVGLE